MHQHVQAQFLLQSNDIGNLGAHLPHVFGIVDLAPGEGLAGLADLDGLRKGPDGRGGKGGQS
ncbi:Uncharacterised protein [Mycobacteroides abscessus subsp. abscessus]|nr:Uncharacterised protein [Mycobacteroides abscessus subsp. abscessus]